MPSQADQRAVDAEQAVLNAMINLPLSGKPLRSEYAIPYAIERLLETAQGTLDDTQALREIIAAVKRLGDEGIIAAPRNGIWKRLRI